MFNEIVLSDMVEIEGIGCVVRICAYSACSEDIGGAGAEIYGGFEGGDGHVFCYVFAGVGEDVVVCEGVYAGTG